MTIRGEDKNLRRVETIRQKYSLNCNFDGAEKTKIGLNGWYTSEELDNAKLALAEWQADYDSHLS